MEIVQSNEAFKRVDGKFQFQYMQGFIRIDKCLYVAKWNNRTGPPVGLYDQYPVITEDRGPKIEPDWTLAKGYGCHIKTPSLLAFAEEPRLEELIRREIVMCDVLKQNPHPNIARYFGCLVTRGRVSGLCFEKYIHTLGTKANPRNLHKVAFLQSGRPFVDDSMRQSFSKLKSAVTHLHSLNIVHNDITPANIMLGENGMVLMDFDSCRWAGEDLRSESGLGTKRTYGWHDPAVTVSLPKNDLDALAEMETWLFGESADDFLFM
ncbi:hypothetical protein B0I35DRAFT_365130 [Stachybotrys elegans]|uniref:EKC/KEOPS complex subunit BUD32 n=1 Tax=Stachybotrys elegans TaxID=80388 RepID=A0A8K0SCU4_9HYPO|nr:hypothetical protein B0I35DRAFT_365130 [Stachybotrys elegans]